MGTEIAVFDIRYKIKNAGPSPDDNRRTEIYFAGCNKALSGNACPECFNTMIWSRNKALVKPAEAFVEAISNHNVPKFITIVGGEPTDQLEGLIAFGKKAKEDCYHIILFSWHERAWLEENLGDAVRYFDIIIPGEYRKMERIYNEDTDDGIHNMIGSGNQMVWIPAEKLCYKAADVASLVLSSDRVLEVTMNNGSRINIAQ